MGAIVFDGASVVATPMTADLRRFLAATEGFAAGEVSEDD